jgi:hypothetical protein
MFSEGNAVHPVRSDSPLQIVMAVWHTFLYLNLLGWCDIQLQIVMAVGRASNLKKKSAKWPLLSAEGCHILTDHSAELFAEGRRALKAVKAL